MLRLLLATTNPGKIAELTRLLCDLPCAVSGLSALPQLIPPVAETGTTFAENALLKADYYAGRTGLLTLADDSGLEVDALAGAPGLHSARYAGENATDSERITRLLEELKDVPHVRRTARFRCSLALVGEGVREVFEGSCEGYIASAPRGRHGFGYDPIFLEAQTGRTFGELTREEKDKRSHRRRALAAAQDFLTKTIKRRETDGRR